MIYDLPYTAYSKYVHSIYNLGRIYVSFKCSAISICLVLALFSGTSVEEESKVLMPYSKKQIHSFDHGCT